MKKQGMWGVLWVVSVCLILGSVAWAVVKMPGADAKELWQYISETAPYQKWSFWPDHQGMQPGNAPHGPFHKVYVNPPALNSKKAPAEYGSIVVKENYGKDKTLKALTVMYKLKDYNPEAGDWFWAKYSPDGKADKAGKVKGCINCHAAHKANDYVMLHQFK